MPAYLSIPSMCKTARKWRLGKHLRERNKQNTLGTHRLGTHADSALKVARMGWENGLTGNSTDIQV